MNNFEAIGLIFSVNALLYLKTLRFKFVSDDFSCWKNPPVAKNRWHKIWLQLTGQMKIYSKSLKFVRVAPDSSKPTKKKWFAVIAKTEETEHLLALGIHISICTAIYFAFGASWTSFVAAILYSVNPINNQGTVWPSGRGFAYPILFLLLSMCLPFYLAPLCLFSGSWYTAGFPSSLTLIGSKWWWYIPAFMPIIWAIHSRKFTKAVSGKRRMECYDEDKKVHPKKLILAIKTFGFYFALCLIPFKITFYHSFLQSLAGSQKHKGYTLCRYFWIGLFVLAGMIYLGFSQWDSFIWALMAFFIAIAPFTNLYRANQEIAERFCALPNVFLMYALAQVLAPYPVLISAFVSFYATRTFYTIKMYQDEFYVSEIAIVEDENAWWAWHCNAMKRWDNQSYKEALILWVRSLMASPREFKILLNIATCLRVLRNDKEADIYLNLAQENIVPGQEKEALGFIEDHKRGKLPILL